LEATSPTVYVAHPPALPGQVSCTTCHVLNRQGNPAMFEDMSTAIPPRTPDVCFQCHEREKFMPTHAHRIEHLMFCQMCHDPHGANRPALMKIPRDEACGKCHE
ncbi:hypothetical protein FJY63_15465, partial [Candidatus Sumerlaeota bacterium]|nr:hypothetical protein [Candidatus Sumerlaeota bacterium]